MGFESNQNTLYMYEIVNNQIYFKKKLHDGEMQLLPCLHITLNLYSNPTKTNFMNQKKMHVLFLWETLTVIRAFF